MLGQGTIGQFTIGQVGTAAAVENITEDKWHQPWSEPIVMTRAGLRVADQSFFYFAPNPVVPFSWYEELSTPVRVKPRLPTPSQAFMFFQPTPIIDISWFEWLAEPVRKKVGTPVHVQPFFSFQPTPIINISWFEWFSEPVRNKPRLLESAQQFAQFFPTPIVPFSWYANFSDPVRVKPRLHEGLQQFMARGEFTPVSYDGYMSATETRDFFLAVLYQFNIPVLAYVDIIENDPRHRGNMAIIENIAQPSIVASIVEPQTVPATGSVVSAVAGARVAIITGP